MKAGDLLSSGKTIAGLAGGLFGAASGKDSTQTSSRDPWGPAQPFLTQLIGQGQTLATDLQAHPFSDAQKTAYGNNASLLNAINTGAPGLLAGFQANASGMNNYDRSNPRKQLTGSSFNLNGFTPSLLSYFGGK